MKFSQLLRAFSADPSDYYIGRVYTLVRAAHINVSTRLSGEVDEYRNLPVGTNPDTDRKREYRHRLNYLWSIITSTYVALWAPYTREELDTLRKIAQEFGGEETYKVITLDDAKRFMDTLESLCTEHRIACAKRKLFTIRLKSAFDAFCLRRTVEQVDLHRTQKDYGDEILHTVGTDQWSFKCLHEAYRRIADMVGIGKRRSASGCRMLYDKYYGTTPTTDDEEWSFVNDCFDNL